MELNVEKKQLNELENTSILINKEALAEWMQKNLPKNYTQRDYEDFYKLYKRTALSNIPKNPNAYKIDQIVKTILDIPKISIKDLALDNPTPIETMIAMELKAQKIPYIHQFPLGNYKLDFAIQYDGKRIDLECDGQEFHKKDYKQERQDKIRDKYVISQGWLPIRFSGAQIHKNSIHCIKIVRDIINLKKPL